MTDREKAKDLKEFQELLKAEVAKLGNYECDINSITLYEIRKKVELLENSIYAVNFHGDFYSDIVAKQALELATKAFVLTTNAQKSFNTFQARDC